ncbi:hypothetical protein R1flu_018544 [Riccia fluitans]|uniref:HhH-GPD domain-containing protein n=1 Tax=Riccia fluitans TaxID=41844 RepID=A0ABD1ZG47_9MARC
MDSKSTRFRQGIKSDLKVRQNSSGFFTDRTTQVQPDVLTGAEVQKTCGKNKLRQGTESNLGTGLTLKWGAKNFRRLRSGEGDSRFLLGQQKGLQSERTLCLPKMINNESIPMAVRMEKRQIFLPQSSPAGPKTPVPKQKRSKKRKLDDSVDDRRRRPDPYVSNQCMYSPAGERRMMPIGSGSLFVNIPLSPARDTAPEPLRCPQEQEIVSTSPLKFQSPISSEESQVQPAAQYSNYTPDNHIVESTKYGVKGGTISDDMDDIQIAAMILDTTPLFHKHCSQVNSRSATAQGNGSSRQLKENSSCIGGSVEGSFFVRNFILTKKPRSGQKRRAYPELEQYDCTTREESEDDVLSILNPEFLPDVKSRTPKAKKKLFDLNKPAVTYDSDFCLEESADLTQKRKILKKHSRPKVLSDVTKPVRVPKPKKATTPRKAGSTKPRGTKAESSKPRSTKKPGRTKKTHSHAAQAPEEGVFQGCNGNEVLGKSMVLGMVPRENSVESFPRLRMRAAARSKERSMLKYSDFDLSKAMVLVSNSQRALVPYARSRLKGLKPKVQLEDGDLQWWKLVMAHGPTYEDKCDEATSEKWANERSKFKHRAEGFIYLMQKVQGDRRFSQWKGSVIDSIVGAFLTQNVSDHLSSSAFMLLAAKYPVSRKRFTEVTVQESFERESLTTPLRNGLAEDFYVVEEPTAIEDKDTFEDSGSTELQPLIEELVETEEFWQAAPTHSMQDIPVNVESQHQGDAETRDARGESSGDFKIVDLMNASNSPGSSLSEQDVCTGGKHNTSLNRIVAEEAAVGSAVMDLECRGSFFHELQEVTIVRASKAHPVQSSGDTEMSGVQDTLSEDCEMRERLYRDNHSGACSPQIFQREDSSAHPIQIRGDTGTSTCDAGVSAVQGTTSRDCEMQELLEGDRCLPQDSECMESWVIGVSTETATSLRDCNMPEEAEEENPSEICVSQDVHLFKDSQVHDSPEELTNQNFSSHLDHNSDDAELVGVKSTSSEDGKVGDGVEEDDLSGCCHTQNGEGKDCLVRDDIPRVSGDRTQPAPITGDSGKSLGDTVTRDVHLSLQVQGSSDCELREGLEVDRPSECGFPVEVKCCKDSLVNAVSGESAVRNQLADPVPVTDNIQTNISHTGMIDFQGTSSRDCRTQEGLEAENQSESCLTVWAQPDNGTCHIQNRNSPHLEKRTVLGGYIPSADVRDSLEDSNRSEPSLPPDVEGEEFVVLDVPKEITVTSLSADPVRSSSDVGTTDLQGLNSGDFTSVEDGNSPGSSPPQDVNCNDCLIHDAVNEITGSNSLTDQVQSGGDTGASDALDTGLGEGAEDCNHSESSPPKEDGCEGLLIHHCPEEPSGPPTPEKISYNNLTGPQRAQLEQNRTKSKDNVNWEQVRKASQSTNGASVREVEDSISWEGVRAAKVDEIAAVIKERGMNNMLAGRIKAFLKRVSEAHGKLDLEWLRDIPPEEAKKFLLSIHGLGLKSAECVRLLTLRHLAFPVDTNVGRICVRLGWVPIEPLPELKLLSELETYPVQESIQKYLWPRLCTLDQDTLYELHYQMITFGKVFCTKRDPNCAACPLRDDCKHYNDSVLSRPTKPPEITLPIQNEPGTSHQETLALSAAEHTSTLSVSEPIIEEPPSPLRQEEFAESENKKVPSEDSMQPADGSSTAIVLVPDAVAKRPVPKLKSVGRLRTVHYVYELTDDHPLVEHIGARVEDDPCPILLAIWGPGESPSDEVCFTDSLEASEETVKGTLLVPCRTANRGAFPLNGTYFQVNEVFADHESSSNPIRVHRRLLWNLPRRKVYFGTSVTSIFKGLSVDEIQDAFQNGYICVRGFDSKTRAPKPLQPRLHAAASLKALCKVVLSFHLPAIQPVRRQHVTNRVSSVHLFVALKPTEGSKQTSCASNVTKKGDDYCFFPAIFKL